MSATAKFSPPLGFQRQRLAAQSAKSIAISNVDKMKLIFVEMNNKPHYTEVTDPPCRYKYWSKFCCRCTKPLSTVLVISYAICLDKSSIPSHI